ncbi:hypothetical protein Salat_1683000 [Sesamum alatum]|uniref:Myb/SANT-like domain-containing protein n=1 Tax=Sesamum alatum TaxID=300844 RepID=A0AAE2CK48_9LAMI|nr:hypothetical protein Salat_1683000 [Sesamum alatum]
MAEANLGPLAPPPPPPPPPPPFNILPQSHYFYTTRWTKRVDMAFIQALYYKAMRGQKQLSRTPNMHSLNYARGIVNGCFNWSSKYIVFKRRLERLRLRFTTFKSIIETPGVQWDRRTNFVTATDEQWNDLALGNEFVNAYRQEGEPMWKELKAIFDCGRRDEGPHEHLAISSDEGEPNDDETDNASEHSGSGGSTISD